MSAGFTLLLLSWGSMAGAIDIRRSDRISAVTNGPQSSARVRSCVLLPQSNSTSPWDGRIRKKPTGIGYCAGGAVRDDSTCSGRAGVNTVGFISFGESAALAPCGRPKGSPRSNMQGSRQRSSRVLLLMSLVLFVSELFWTSLHITGLWRLCRFRHSRSDDPRRRLLHGSKTRIVRPRPPSPPRCTMLFRGPRYRGECRLDQTRYRTI